MNTDVKLNILPEELVNQIAAGEVIERPASVVKELLDNSIDAGADGIYIKIINGGIDSIEVSDNGIGIPERNLKNIFKAHTTSKIASVEDLNNLLTMGFRGEALSTILAVSNVKVISKYINEDFANEITFKNISDSEIKKAARESGTIVKVQNIFENIPARKKFLKTAQTEYRKILEILTPYFLIYPNISFILEKDSKKVIDLKKVEDKKAGEICLERLEKVLKGEYAQKMIKVFSDGSGTKITGYVGHPSSHSSRVEAQYIFVNRRSVWDSGIARATLEGFSRYIPHGEKIPFVLNIQINPDLLDVNVHPRKEEVRFLNPFRVYSAVEDAVSKAVSREVSYSNKIYSKPEYREYVPNIPNRNISFKDTSRSVQESIQFSRQLLQEEEQSKYIPQGENPYANDQEYIQISNNIGEVRNIFQIFNKYICIEFSNEEFWIIDQHAAAERINFERLRDGDLKDLDIQKLLVPNDIKVSDLVLEFFKENIQIFRDLGFEINIKDENIQILSVPSIFVKADISKMFLEVISLIENVDTKKDINRIKEDMIATIACHGSIRAGRYLHKEEMLDIYNKLLICKNPYSCPHGRPAIWKLTLDQIDSHFERTY